MPRLIPVTFKALDGIGEVGRAEIPTLPRLHETLRIDEIPGALFVVSGVHHDISLSAPGASRVTVYVAEISDRLCAPDASANG